MLVTSTRDPGMRVSFVEAAERNAPADGGLYLPVLGPGGLEPFADVEELLALPFRPRSAEILSRLLTPEFARGEVAAMVESALDFPVVHREVRSGLSVLELFHGPSLSFKDFGVRFLAQVLSRLRECAVVGGESGPRTVLTATSGDTGARNARPACPLSSQRRAYFLARNASVTSVRLSSPRMISPHSQSLPVCSRRVSNSRRSRSASKLQKTWPRIVSSRL